MEPATYEKFSYPAIFHYEKPDKIAVIFPDLYCATSGKTTEDAMESAAELLCIVRDGYQHEGIEMPLPSSIVDIPVGENEALHMICVERLTHSSAS